MKLLGVIGAILYSISPILALYVNGNSPKSGYMSVQSARGISRTGIRVMQQRHYPGNSDKNTDSIVDSHFKVMKSAPHIHVYNSRNEKRRDIRDGWNTESSNKQTRNVIIDDFANQPGSKSNDPSGRQIEQKVNSQRSNVHQPRSKPILGQENWVNAPPRSIQAIRQIDYMRDAKPNYINVNVHKMPISTDSQKAIRISNRQIAPLSKRRPEEINEKKSTTLKLENIKSPPVQRDLPSNVTSQKDDDVTRHFGDNYKTHKQVRAEYRKRDIDYNHEGKHVKRNTISDPMRKYIVSKDKKINVERKSINKFSRIGIQEDNIQSEDSPYAIFYRMHPETLDEQEVFVPMGSIEENADVFSSSKYKRLSNKFPSEITDLTGTVPKSKAKKVKFHKKVKNFANYRLNPNHEHAG